MQLLLLLFISFISIQVTSWYKPYTNGNITSHACNGKHFSQKMQNSPQHYFLHLVNHTASWYLSLLIIIIVTIIIFIIIIIPFSKFQFDPMHDLRENLVRVGEASWVNIILFLVLSSLLLLGLPSL